MSSKSNRGSRSTSARSKHSGRVVAQITLDAKGRKLRGLVACHHTIPRFVPFPLRYACEFLMQVFGVQLNKEVGLAAQAEAYPPNANTSL